MPIDNLRGGKLVREAREAWRGSAIRRWYNGLHEFWRHLIPNLAFGFVALLISHHLHDALFFRSITDEGIDLLLRLQEGRTANSGQGLKPYVFIEIDESTYQTWKGPLSVPRDKLMKLIRYAAESGARLVIVDVELSRWTAPADDELGEYLAQIAFPSGSSTAEEPYLGTHIVLLTGFRNPLPVQKSRLPERRPSFLDGVVARAQNLHWASATFEVEDDGVVRRWYLWKSACRYTNGRPEIVPSMQLIAAALLLDCKMGTKSQLETALKPLQLPDCEGEDQSAQSHDGYAPILACSGERNIELNPRSLERRILYSLPWKLNEQVPLLIRMPAEVITEQSKSPDDWIKNHIVIIGASYSDGRDVYNTPLGKMPGALININAIHSLTSYGELNPLSTPMLIGIQMLLIAAISIIFFRFPPPFLAMLISLGVMALMIPLSFFLFQSAVWLDWAIPMFVVTLYEMWEDVKETWRSLWRRK